MDRLVGIGTYLTIIPLCCLILYQLADLAWHGITGIWDTALEDLIGAAGIAALILTPIGIVLLVIGMLAG